MLYVQCMEDTGTVERLVRLGLMTYEARAYVTLVRRDSFTAAQIARTAGLPRQRIYDVLASPSRRVSPPRDPARS